MKKTIHILFFIIGILLIPQPTFAQVDFNKRPDDDLGNVEDEFQEYFFEALKQKGIENYDRAEIMRKTENIYNTTLEILDNAKVNNLTTHNAALNIAKERIETRRRENAK